MKFIISLALILTFIFVSVGHAQQQPSVEGMIDVLDIRDLDIKDAVKLLAQKSGLNIISGDSVQGMVSVYLKNIPAREALATILQTSDAAYEDGGGVIYVISGQEYESKYGRPFSQRVISRMFHLHGLKASAAAVLVERLKNQFGKVVADDVSGTLYVEDMPVKLTEIDNYLREVDRPLESRLFSLQYLEAEATALRINEFLSKDIGSSRFDKGSDKIFVTDLPEKLVEVEQFLRVVDIPRKPKVFELSYAKVDEIAGVLKQYLTPDLGSLETNKRTNQIIVIDTEVKIKELGEVIKQLDKKEPEVLIEARIVQVYLNDTFKMGIDWDAIVTKAHGLEMKTSWGGVGSDAKSSLKIGTLSNDNYAVVVEALGSISESHVLSNPRIAVVNNEEARIMVGTTKPYVTSTTTTPTSGPATVSEDVKFIDVGVKLLVTPTIHADGFVTMKIRPEVSSATNSVTTAHNNTIPIVETSEVDTTVRVKDGVTVVIGGLIKDENVQVEKGIPFFKSIPFLGNAFRSQSRSKENTEIVIFLTPRIMTGDVK